MLHRSSKSMNSDVRISNVFLPSMAQARIKEPTDDRQQGEGGSSRNPLRGMLALVSTFLYAYPYASYPYAYPYPYFPQSIVCESRTEPQRHLHSGDSTHLLSHMHTLPAFLLPSTPCCRPFPCHASNFRTPDRRLLGAPPVHGLLQLNPSASTAGDPDPVSMIQYVFMEDDVMSVAKTVVVIPLKNLQLMNNSYPQSVTALAFGVCR